VPKIRVLQSFSGLLVAILVTFRLLFGDFITDTGKKKATDGFGGRLAYSASKQPPTM
jgi:hypothetical protein